MRHHRITFALLTLLFLLSDSYLFAGKYYIALNGSNNNSGSITQPWATIMYAVEHTSPGDSILMRGGTYPVQEEIWIRNTYGHGGSPGNWKTIMAYPGETVMLSQRFLVDANYIRVERLSFHNGRVLAAVEWDSPTSHVEFLNNYFSGPYNVYDGAIHYKGSYGLIEGNRLELENTGSTTDQGIYILSGTNTIVRNNYISGPPAYGIHIYDEPNGYTPRIENVTVENNIVIGSHLRSGIVVAIHQNSNPYVRIQGVKIHNNVVINNAEGGLLLSYGRLRNVEVYNNVFYNNGLGGIGIYSEDLDSLKIINNVFSMHQGGYHIYNNSNIVSFVLAYNLYFQPQSVGSGANDLHPLFGDPLFVDPAGNDFHLSHNSPAIDAGIFVGLPFLGSAPDMGAFEYEPPVGPGNDPSNPLPKKCCLYQNYPNPFNPETTIAYEVSETAHVQIRIYDALGSEVRELIDEPATAGVFSVIWNGKDTFGKDLATGVYFCTMRVFNAQNGKIFSDSKKLLLVR